MKILIANDGFADAGGVQTYIAAIVSGLLERGHEIRWLTHDAPPVGKASPFQRTLQGYSIQQEGVERVFRELGEWAPQICYSHNMRFLDLEEQLLSRWPVIKFMHGYFGTCISGLKMHAFPQATPCHRRFGTACLGLYFPRRCGQLKPSAWWKGFNWASHQQKLFNRYQALVVASAHMQREYAANGMQPAKIHAIPLFGPVGALPEMRELQTAHPTVLFLGRMTGLKGGDLLIQAAASASVKIGKSIHLILAGDGPMRVHWEGLARKLSVNATFTGWVGPAERDELLHESTLLCVPSVWPEPFALVGLEAARFGVPAVAFDVGGISEWLKHGHNGLLATGNPPKAEALAARLSEALADPERLRCMGQAAHQVASKMSLDSHLDQLEKVLIDAVRKRS